MVECILLKELSELTGAEIIKGAIIKNNLQRVFVYPGGTIAPILDELYKEKIELFCTKHEQGAAYAAIAVAKLTGMPQVIMVTSGPGVTNVITPIADSYFDSIPIVLITGQVATSDLKGNSMNIRQRGFQEVQTISILKTLTKAQFLVKDILELERVLDEAFDISTKGRPGPVVIDLPMDIQRGILNNTIPSMEKTSNQQHIVPDISPEKIKQISDKIQAAKKPVIIAGQGILTANAHLEFQEFVNKTHIPVSHSLLGLGAYPGDSPFTVGFHGHTGNRYANKTIYEADLVLVFGSRLDVRQTGTCYEQFSPKAYIIKIDIDENEIINSRIRSDFYICTDIKEVLSMLNYYLEDLILPKWEEWWKFINDWRGASLLSYNNDGKLKAQYVIEAVNELTRGCPLICTTGVGSHQQWVARHFHFNYPERIFLTSGGHGAMGFDLPSAIGAQLAYPDRMILCFAGDGSIQMNIQELATISECGLPIKIIVLDNQRLAMVSQFQLFNWGNDPTCGNKVSPAYAEIAKAYNIKNYIINKKDEVGEVLKSALFYDGPCLIHCLVDDSEDVVPMLLGGQPMSKMWPYE